MYNAVKYFTSVKHTRLKTTNRCKAISCRLSSKRRVARKKRGIVTRHVRIVLEACTNAELSTSFVYYDRSRPEWKTNFNGNRRSRGTRESSPNEMCSHSAKFFLFHGCGVVIYTFCGSRRKKRLLCYSVNGYFQPTKFFRGKSIRMYK